MKTQLKCKENLRLGILVPKLLDTDMNQADVRLVASDGTSFSAHKVPGTRVPDPKFQLRIWTLFLWTQIRNRIRSTDQRSWIRIILQNIDTDLDLGVKIGYHFDCEKVRYLPYILTI